VIATENLEQIADLIGEPGTLSILNCGAGDVRLCFDPAKPVEMEHAKAVVQDMIRRGYILMIEIEPGQWRRCKGFDPERYEYIVLDTPSDFGPIADTAEPEPEKIVVQNIDKRRGRPRKIPAGSVKAVSVAPTGGG